MRPEGARPTAATENLEMGGRARGWAVGTRVGRSSGRVTAADSAMAKASEAEIKNLRLG